MIKFILGVYLMGFCNALHGMQALEAIVALCLNTLSSESTNEVTAKAQQFKQDDSVTHKKQASVPETPYYRKFKENNAADRKRADKSLPLYAQYAQLPIEERKQKWLNEEWPKISTKCRFMPSKINHAWDHFNRHVNQYITMQKANAKLRTDSY